MTVLVICEKKIAAERIAEILSDGKAKTKSLEKHPYFEFDRDGGHWAVVGLSGHVVEVDYPSEYNRWDRINPRELIYVEPIKRVPREYGGLVRALKRLGKEADQAIVATDYDREGELIGKEALDLLLEIHPDLPVRRARFSSLTPKEVRAAFAKLAGFDEHLAAAGESRQLVDLVWGAVLTRLISMYSGQRGDDFLSVGRVQSPTLALIVDREKERRAFQPRPYWTLTATLGSPPHTFVAHHPGQERGEDEDEDQEEAGGGRRFYDEAEAQRVYDKIRGAKEAQVQDVRRSDRLERAPTPFNTTEFLKAAASAGFGAARAMQVAETLYMRGFTSYPRTDNTVYPPTEDLEEILRGLRQAQAFAADVDYLATVRRPEPTRGKKTATDHPPIHPVEAARRDQLHDAEWKVYDLIVRRFLATLAKDAEGENLRADLAIRDEPFRASGYRTRFAGWKQLYPFEGRSERPLPDLQAGQTVPVQSILLDRKETQPPRRFGQGTLVARMEELGLGTKSTRHETIDKLMKRDYVKGKDSLEPTPSGFAVTDALEKYAEAIAKPDMTRALEEEMELVAEGKKEVREVVEDSRRLLDEAAALVEKHREQIGSEIRKALHQQNVLGKCPTSGHDMVVRRGRSGKQFVACTGYPGCTQTYPLPQRGKIVPLGQACPECGAPRVRLLQARRRPWDLCVNYYGCPTNKARAAAPPSEASASPESEEADSTE